MTDKSREDDLISEFDSLVADDSLPSSGDAFMSKVSTMVDNFYGTGEYQVAEDALRGGDKDLAEDSHLYYVMFWRMFDKTPASMMQDFAINLRRVLAKKVFKSVGEGVTIHHNVLFNSGKNITIGDGVFLNRNVMLDDRGPVIIGDYTGLAAGAIIETHNHVVGGVPAKTIKVLAPENH